VVAIACELPADRGMPLSRWSSLELACGAIEAGVVAETCASTVRRWLAHHQPGLARSAPLFSARTEIESTTARDQSIPPRTPNSSNIV
jgi:hypothetical protein